MACSLSALQALHSTDLQTLRAHTKVFRILSQATKHQALSDRQPQSPTQSQHPLCGAMANKRNQARKATKAARDAAFRASHAQQIKAIRSKATGQR